MDCLRKKSFQAVPYFLMFFLLAATSMPLAALGQQATTTQETVTSTLDASVPEINTATSTATSTEAMIPSDGNATAEGGQVLGEATTSNPEITDEEVSPTEESNQQTANDTAPPPLSVRKFQKRIIVDKKAAHACEAETFRIDISGKMLVQTRIMFLRDSDNPYEIEIGGLPDGIDVTITKNNRHRYVQEAGDKYLTLTIQNQDGSQKGNFSVPIIYTRKDTQDSSVICQINIVNQ